MTDGGYYAGVGGAFFGFQEHFQTEASFVGPVGLVADSGERFLPGLAHRKSVV